MNDKRIRQIERAIENDEKFMSALFWEYRNQLLDQLDCLRELGGNQEQESRLLDTAKDAAFIAWFYRPAKQ